MNRRCFVLSAFASSAPVFQVSRSLAQTRAFQPDLAKLAGGKGLTIFNRTISPLKDGLRTGFRVSESPGEGVAYVDGVEFAGGTIEIDVRGKDVAQQSFVGLAFHGVDGATYDAVYFRPFNFKADDVARRSRAVQYIAHPSHPWQKLRAEHPGKYEHAVTPVPDPNGWFHVRIVVASPKVSVFVEDAKEPSLTVSQLSERRKGRVGVWVGNNSGGDFSNLRVIPA